MPFVLCLNHERNTIKKLKSDGMLEADEAATIDCCGRGTNEGGNGKFVGA
jgi:hypothetical protein